MDAKQYNDSVDEWAEALFRFARKTIRDDEEAKDMVQNAFEILWINRESVSVEKAKSFLFTVVYRRCMDFHRKEKPEIVEVLPDNRSENNQDQLDLKKLLAKAFEHLHPRDKQLILLKDWEGYNYEEISTITNYSSAQVKVYLHRARKCLKNIINQLEDVRYEYK